MPDILFTQTPQDPTNDLVDRINSMERNRAHYERQKNELTSKPRRAALVERYLNARKAMTQLKDVLVFQPVASAIADVFYYAASDNEPQSALITHGYKHPKFIETILRPLKREKHTVRSQLSSRKRGIADAVQNVTQLDRDLPELKMQLAMKQGSSTGSRTINLQQLADNIVKLPLVQRVRTYTHGTQADLLIELFPLTMNNSASHHDDDNTVDLAATMLVLSLDNNSAVANAELYGDRVRGYEGNTLVHPHWISDGDPCLGDFGGVITELNHAGDYLATVEMYILYLQQFNSDDAAGEYACNWHDGAEDDEGDEYYSHRDVYPKPPRGVGVYDTGNTEYIAPRVRSAHDRVQAAMDNHERKWNGEDVLMIAPYPHRGRPDAEEDEGVYYALKTRVINPDNVWYLSYNDNTSCPKFTNVVTRESTYQDWTDMVPIHSYLIDKAEPQDEALDTQDETIAVYEAVDLHKAAWNGEPVTMVSPYKDEPRGNREGEGCYADVREPATYKNVWKLKHNDRTSIPEFICLADGKTTYFAWENMTLIDSQLVDPNCVHSEYQPPSRLHGFEPSITIVDDPATENLANRPDWFPMLIDQEAEPETPVVGEWYYTLRPDGTGVYVYILENADDDTLECIYSSNEATQSARIGIATNPVAKMTEAERYECAKDIHASNRWPNRSPWKAETAPTPEIVANGTFRAVACNEHRGHTPRTENDIVLLENDGTTVPYFEYADETVSEANGGIFCSFWSSLTPVHPTTTTTTAEEQAA